MEKYHLAQINIATALWDVADPGFADFMNNLDLINKLAEDTPGFVWRLQTPEGNATSIRVYDHDRIMLNMSVWESLDALYQYTYYSDHTAFFRRRAEWFEKPTAPITALWWIPAGTIPTPLEGKERLDLLRSQGATPLAFTFKERFTVEEMLEYQAKLEIQKAE